MEQVFISQPMKGKPQEMIWAERDGLVKTLREKGFNVIDSVSIKAPAEIANNPVFFLSRSIRLLAAADIVYFMDGWKEARGCRIEHIIAEEYGIPIMKD